MNYGKEFIKKYNQLFIELKKDYIEYLKNNFNSDYRFSVISDNYVRKLNELKKSKYDKESFLTESYEDFYFRYYKFSKNSAKKSIDDIVYQNYDEKKDRIQIEDFNGFIYSLAKYALIEDFKKRLKDDYDQNELGFEKKDISKILKVKKQKDAEFLVHYAEYNKKEQTKTKDSQNRLKRNIYDNPFNKDEKILLMHFLLKHEKIQEDKLSNYEITLILKLSSGGFENEKLIRVRDTTYDKILNGINHYAIQHRKITFQTLLTKLEKFECSKFKQFLNNEFYKL